MMEYWQRRTFTMMLPLMLAVAFDCARAAEADVRDDIKVNVDIQRGVVRVNADLQIPASAREVWEVFTDFEHLPRFISNITSSSVLSRDGNVVRVAQEGKTRFGLLSFSFQSERELTLTPFEKIESRMLSGNMKRFHGTTQFEAEGGITRVLYHSEAVPDTLLPLSLGRSLIESETREHYHEIRQEVLRRKRQ